MTMRMEKHVQGKAKVGLQCCYENNKLINNNTSINSSFAYSQL